MKFSMPQPLGLVLITGAAQRIGKAIAIYLAARGWDVGLHFNTSRRAAEETALQVAHLGQMAFLAQADLENPAATAALIPALAAQGGPVTALVNNASLFEEDSRDPTGARHRRINFEAPLQLAELFGTQLPAGVSGAVAHLLDATTAPAHFSHYAASKRRLAESIPAAALAATPRFTVNGVAPGPTLINPRESPEHFDRLVKTTPLGRASTPAEVAAAVATCLTTPSLTGQILRLDGGAHLTPSGLR